MGSQLPPILSIYRYQMRVAEKQSQQGSHPQRQNRAVLFAVNPARVRLISATERMAVYVLQMLFRGRGVNYSLGSASVHCTHGRGTATGRGLSEEGFNSTILSNSTGLLPSLVPSLANITIACPCNCTYVSEAYCFSDSGVVHNAASLKLGVLEPPDSQTFCNKTTGDFQTAN